MSTPPVHIRIPAPMLAAAERAAELTGRTRSEVIRAALERELRAAGVWPPRAEGAADVQ